MNNPLGPINPPAPGPKPKAPRDLTNEKADLVWTTADVWDKWANRRTEYLRLYSDSIIEVSGKVWDFDAFGYYAPADTITMNLENHTAFLIIHMAGREPWARVIPGQDVKIRGRVPRSDEFIAEPLVNCIILEPQHSSAVQGTAGQLYREALADSQKYNKKYLIVSGEVVRKSLVNALFVELKGDGATTVRCQVESKMGFTLDHVQVGQKLKMVGQYVTLDKTNGLILNKCLPITQNVE